jgi:hypothetical protein
MYSVGKSNFWKHFSCLKVGILDRDKYPKMSLFDFFSLISWGLSTGTKGEKLEFFGFSINGSKYGIFQ